MNDAFLLIFGLIFLFCVWVYTGGPTHPIAFAGPYITPITNVGQVQSGYGKGETYHVFNSASYDGNPKTGSYYTGLTGTETGTQTSAQSTQKIPESQVRQRIADIKQQVNALQKFGTPSPYRGQVRIESVSTSYQGQSSSNEYVTVAVGQFGDGIDITGWKLVSSITGSIATIPQGEEFPGDKVRGTVSDIELDPGQQARVYTGKSARDASYLENECTGYFRPADPNGYSSASCPAPYGEFQKFYTGSAVDYDKCSAYIQTLQSCVTPSDVKNSASQASINVPNSCINFAYSALSYSGCTENHYDDNNFFGNTWDIYLNHLNVLWRQDSDTIKLLDRDGKTVDLYSY